ATPHRRRDWTLAGHLPRKSFAPMRAAKCISKARCADPAGRALQRSAKPRHAQHPATPNRCRASAAAGRRRAWTARKARTESRARLRLRRRAFAHPRIAVCFEFARELRVAAFDDAAV